MVSAKDAEPQKLIEKTAEELKKVMKQPEWSRYVKTGVSRERPPENAEWWYMRAASVLRKVYVDGPVGISRLRSFYGGLHRRGHKPAHFAKGGGKVVRVILQDLEKAGYVKQAEKRKGRVITPAGQKFLNSVAKQVR